MKKAKSLIFAAPIFLLFSFVKPDLFPMDEKIPEPDAIVHQIMDDTIATIKRRYNASPCGIGMNGKFEYLEISFEINEKLSRDKIRNILLDSGEEFLKNINDSEKVRPYLKDYPFTHKNIGIALFISDKDNRDLFDPDICCASFERGIFEYHTTAKENTFQYKDTFEETFEEALTKIAESKNLYLPVDPE